MAVTDASWLIDKSALVRIARSQSAEIWLDRINRGLVHISVATLLEVGYSALSPADWSVKVEEPPIALMPLAGITPAVERRAVEVQGILAGRGHHRAPSVPDLLNAAIGEVHGLVVLHQDEDFDLIAEITGQPLERID